MKLINLLIPSKRFMKCSFLSCLNLPICITMIMGGVNMENAYKNILVAIDGSKGSENALTKAINLAKRDRKSTRLNSSHVAISYAVFCLKKKKKKNKITCI